VCNRTDPLGSARGIDPQLGRCRSRIQDKHPAAFVAPRFFAQGPVLPAPERVYSIRRRTGISRFARKEPVSQNGPIRSGGGGEIAFIPSRFANSCYTLFNRRIRSEVLACSGYRLLANFHIALGR
jgi:hypothetical protein